MEIIVDVQCFKRYGEIVFKEIAVVDLSDEQAVPLVYLLKPPCAWEDLTASDKSENLWLQRNFHGLDWNSGHVPYEELCKIFKEIAYVKGEDQPQATVYVKGHQKKHWLASFFHSIFDLEDVACPSLREPGFREGMTCFHHPQRGNWNCAVQNVRALKRWEIRNSILLDGPSLERGCNDYLRMVELSPSQSVDEVDSGGEYSDL